MRIILNDYSKLLRQDDQEAIYNLQKICKKPTIRIMYTGRLDIQPYVILRVNYAYSTDGFMQITEASRSVFERTKPTVSIFLRL